MGQLRINFKMKLLNFSRKRFDLDQYLHLRVDKTAMQMRRYCCLDQATSSLDAESETLVRTAPEELMPPDRAGDRPSARHDIVLRPASSSSIRG
jgi:hypothetical protein